MKKEMENKRILQVSQKGEPRTTAQYPPEERQGERQSPSDGPWLQWSGLALIVRVHRARLGWLVPWSWTNLLGLNVS